MRRPGSLIIAVVVALASGITGPAPVESAATPPHAATLLASWASTQSAKTYPESSSLITYDGRWTEMLSSGYLGGRARSSSQRGAQATISFKGTGITWIGPVGPTRGSARVYLDGKLVRTVNTYASRFSPTRALLTLTFGTMQVRKLEIVVAGTTGHPTVAIDAIAIRTGSLATPTPTPGPGGTPVPTCLRTAPAATGSNQTAVLQGWIDAAPNGSTLCFQPDAVYRSDGILKLDRRRNLTFLGQGATIVAIEPTTENRRNWWLSESTGIAFRDLTVRGANPEPGVFDETHQFEHGFWIDGGGDIDIGDVRLIDQYGDGIYLSDRGGALDWTDGIHIHDVTIAGSGRNCIAIVAARNVTVERVSLSGCGLHAFDIEPNNGDQGADRVVWRDSTVRAPIAGYVFASNGRAGTMTNIRVEHVAAIGKAFRTTVQAQAGYRFANVAIVGNSSDTAARGPVMLFRGIDGLSVTGNDQPLTDGRLISVTDSTDVVVAGN